MFTGIVRERAKVASFDRGRLVVCEQRRVLGGPGESYPGAHLELGQRLVRGRDAPVATSQPPRLAQAEPVPGSSTIAPCLGKKNRASIDCGPSSAHT